MVKTVLWASPAFGVAVTALPQPRGGASPGRSPLDRRTHTRHVSPRAPANGTNLIANSSFEDGADGWTAEGTEEKSGWETNEGFNSAHCYHVRAVDRGDNTVNRIRTPLRSGLNPGSLATIRARVRWLRGHPEILFRLRGTWLEAVGTMTLPTNPGTPGARNGRVMPNAPPAIYDVAHRPVLPAANQPVVVTARVRDPDGLTAVVLNYPLRLGGRRQHSRQR